MSMIPPLMNVFAKSDPSRESANVQIQASAASFERPGAPPHPFPGFTGGACNLRPASRGYVRVRGADPGAAPAILHNYLDAEDDRRVAVGILKLMRRIASARALAPYRPEEYRPGPQARSDAELLAFARENGNTVFHPVGTCKMGHDALAVVDERLRVRGLQALRVADASIMPTICSGNTNSATLMIAEKAADLIKEDRRARLTAPRAEEAVTA
jgi:choline dehydrogenase